MRCRTLYALLPLLLVALLLLLLPFMTPLLPPPLLLLLLLLLETCLKGCQQWVETVRWRWRWLPPSEDSERDHLAGEAYRHAGLVSEFDCISVRALLAHLQPWLWQDSRQHLSTTRKGYCTYIFLGHVGMLSRLPLATIRLRYTFRGSPSKRKVEIFLNIFKYISRILK